MPRTADFDSQRLAGLARKQHSVITRAQALDSGMTNPVIHYRHRDAGPWQVLLPGLYLTHTGQPDDESRDLAALLYAGPDRSRAGGLQCG